jgi:hypothetical protein
MTDITIHNLRISYDETHSRVRKFVEYLKSEKRKEELKSYYEEAKKSSDNKIHLNDKENNEFTMICTGNYSCTLRLRGM